MKVRQRSWVIRGNFAENSFKVDMSQQQDFGYGAYNAPKILFSFSHDGFSLYLSRLLRPVWFENVTKTTPERRVNGTFMVTHTQKRFLIQDPNLLLYSRTAS